jgi:hypothetical protein
MNTITIYSITNHTYQCLQIVEEKKEKNESSSLIMKFIESVSIRNKNTAKQYHLRLLLFAKFVKEKYR